MVWDISKRPIMAVFDGLKVVDFTWIIAGPLLTRYLADHGASVVRVETATRPDVLRTAPPFKDRKPGLNRSGYFASFNSSKYGVSLNLNHPKGVSLARRLVAWGEVVVENLTPGSLARWGLDYPELKKIKPDLIMLSTSNQGQSGPHAHHPGHGGILTSLAGFTHLTGWEDREPCQPFGALTDFFTPCLGAIALVAALEHRRRTGEGQYIDLSQYESSLLFLAPVLMDYMANGHQAQRQGNRSPYAAPHGAYPCRGEDRWCAIVVENEEEWQALCQAIDRPELGMDPRFSSLSQRLEHQAELDRIVGEWTKERSPREVMEHLQRAGVAAGAVRTPAELFSDPQLRHRGHFVPLEHPELGLQHYQMPPFRLSLTPARPSRPAPCLGEHNEYIFREVLGLGEEEWVELLMEGGLE